MKNNTAQTKTTLQKQGIFIAVASAIVVLFLIFYFAILPLIQTKTATIDYVYPGEHLDGGVLYMVDPLERADISKIEVKNAHGTYGLNAKGTGAGTTFMIESLPRDSLSQAPPTVKTTAQTNGRRKRTSKNTVSMPQATLRGSELRVRTVLHTRSYSVTSSPRARVAMLTLTIPQE